jgi:hypothetical protein
MRFAALKMPFASVSAPQQCKMLIVSRIFESAKLAINDEGGWFAKPPGFLEVTGDAGGLHVMA